MIAASGGDYVITGRLIDAGADPARENHQGRSPLLMTFKNWNNEERIGYSLTYQSLLGALKGMLAKGGGETWSRGGSQSCHTESLPQCTGRAVVYHSGADR